jgi:hypothetical protein
MRYVAVLVERRNAVFANYAKYVQQTACISICAVLYLKIMPPTYFEYKVMTGRRGRRR